MLVDAYLPRIVDRAVAESLKSFGAVMIQGPRAVGKTTSGLRAAASSVRLDASPELATLASISPETALAGATPRLIDEWQLAPTLWNAVRHEVDRRGAPGQFILTGSATPPPDDRTRHSGAGRFRRIILRPMTLAESGDSTGEVTLAQLLGSEPIAALGGPSVPEYAELVVRGGWPALVRQRTRSARDYLTSYLEDVARVDLPANELVIDPVRMLALMRALARNVATEVAAARLAAEVEIGGDDGSANGVSAHTVRKYLDALSRVYVVEEQPAWAPHLRSKVRLRGKPKWHFIDRSQRLRPPLRVAVRPGPAGLRRGVGRPRLPLQRRDGPRGRPHRGAVGWRLGGVRGEARRWRSRGGGRRQPQEGQGEGLGPTLCAAYGAQRRHGGQRELHQARWHQRRRARASCSLAAPSGLEVESAAAALP